MSARPQCAPTASGLAQCQLSLFNDQPQFHPSPVVLVIAPDKSIAAAVIFPAPEAHFGPPQRQVQCRALVTLGSGTLYAVDFAQTQVEKPGFWRAIERQCRQQESPGLEMRRNDTALLRDMDKLTSWHLESYIRSRQFDGLCESMAEPGTHVDDDDATRKRLTDQARALLAEQLQRAVAVLLQVSCAGPPADDPTSDVGLGSVDDFLRERRDLQISMFGDLADLANRVDPETQVRMRKASRVWPQPMLRITASPTLNAMGSGLRHSLVDGTSLVDALAKQGVARFVTRRVMRLGRQFPALGVGCFLRVLAAASELSPDRVPLDQKQWDVFASLHIESARLHAALRGTDVERRVREWSWQGPWEEAAACTHRLRQFDKVLKRITGDEDTYSSGEVLQLAEYLLTCTSTQLDRLGDTVAQVVLDLRHWAIVRASVELGAIGPTELLDELLRTLPPIPRLTFEADAAEFSVITDAQTLVGLGADMGNCLSEPHVCIWYLVNGCVLVQARSGAGRHAAVLAIQLPNGSDPLARAALHETQLVTKGGDPALEERIGAFVRWFSSSGYPCSDTRRFRAAVIRTRVAIAEQLRGSIDKMAVWRGVFGRAQKRS